MAFFGLRKKYLAIDDDRAVNVGADQSGAEGIKVDLERGGRVANGDAIVGKAGELFFYALNDIMKADNFFDLNFGLFLGDVDNFDLATVVRGTGLQDLDELDLVGLAAGT